MHVAASGPTLREEVLRGDWAGLLREWNQWGEVHRLVDAFELAGRLIIEKTRIGRPYTLKYAPPATEGLGAGYRRVGDARHDALGPFDFDLLGSLIRNPGENWHPARISGGIEAEAERRAALRLAHEDQDAAAAAAWATRLEKPFRKRDLFSVLEIAEHLTRRSVAEPEVEKRDRVVLDIGDRIRREEFDLTGGSDVVVQIREPPYFRPFGSSEIVRIADEVAGLRIHNAQFIYLRRPACRRYIEANLDLPNAPKLLREWFPEPDSAPQRRSRQVSDRSPTKPVRKTDLERDLRLRNQIETVLAAQRRQWSEPANRPALRQQARLVHQQLSSAQPPLKLGQETIRQILSATYRPMVRLGIGTRDG
jgi:hypothetical protein